MAMNPPTDRERPALSEGEVEALAQTIYEAEMSYMLSIPRMGLRPFTWSELCELDTGKDRYVAAAKAVLASPKPALTQGGVVELVELVEAYRVRVLRVMNRNKMVSDVGLAILIAKDLAATALERRAEERGGEAVALDEVAFRGGFAKGSYECLCMACGETFEGDKRAVHCRPCAIAKALPDPPAAAPQPLPVEVERERIARIIRGWDKPTGGRIGPGTRRAIEDADAKADAILTAHPALGGGGR